MANETILIADEDSRTTKLLEVSLANEGYQVFVTETLEHALEVYRRQNPDLIITSIYSLGGGNGFEFAETVRESATGELTPILMLSDRDSTEERKRSIELGADDYIPKPVYIKEVIERVDFLLRDRVKELLKTDEVREFQGILENFRLIDIFQSIQQKNRSGHLEVVGDRNKGDVYFRNGNILDAKCGSLRGEEAIFRLCCWDKGEFYLTFGDEAHPRKIQRETDDLIMEAIERLDLWNQLTKALPELDRIFVFNADDVSVIREQVNDTAAKIARLFDGVRTLRDVINDSSLGDLSTLQIIRQLFEDNWLAEAPTAEPRSRSSDHWKAVEGPGRDSMGSQEPDHLERHERARRAAEAEQLKSQGEQRQISNQLPPRGVPFGASEVDQEDSAEIIPPSGSNEEGRQQQIAQPMSPVSDDGSHSFGDRFSKSSSPNRRVETSINRGREGKKDRADTPRGEESSTQTRSRQSHEAQNTKPRAHSDRRDAETEGEPPVSAEEFVERDNEESETTDEEPENEETFEDEELELAFEEYQSSSPDWRYWGGGVGTAVIVLLLVWMGLPGSSTESQTASRQKASGKAEAKAKSDEKKTSQSSGLDEKQLRASGKKVATASTQASKRLAMVLSGREPFSPDESSDNDEESSSEEPQMQEKSDEQSPEATASDDESAPDPDPQPKSDSEPSQPADSGSDIDVDAKIEEAKQMLSAGNMSGAEDILSELRQKAPGNGDVPKLYLQLATEYYKADRPTKEQQAYRSYLQLRPEGDRASEIRSILKNRFN